MGLVSRRQILMRGALATAAPLLAASTGASNKGDGDTLMRDVEHYVALGNKRSGGSGDMAVGTWLEREMEALGFRCTRHAIEVPWFEPEEARLSIGQEDFPVLPVGIAVPTPRGGLAGDIRIVAPPGAMPPSDARRGSAPFIALAFLPYARWSSAATPIVGQTVRVCRAAGAAAVILVTTGPTGKAIMLNADGVAPISDIPVATIGYADAARIVASQGDGARLHLRGPAGRRAAFNLVARRGSARGKQLIVSTPRSGWFACGAERGPGIAVWLDLARRLAKEERDIVFLCTSGHEFENLGAEHIIKDALPPPATTSLWIHLGAGFACNDWHEFGTLLVPLHNVDSQRFLAASKSLVATCRRLFAGQPGLEAAYATDDLLTGELKVIVSNGYANCVGLFGAHRFHHLETDGINCVHAEAMAQVSNSLIQLIEEAG